MIFVLLAAIIFVGVVLVVAGGFSAWRGVDSASDGIAHLLIASGVLMFIVGGMSVIVGVITTGERIVAPRHCASEARGLGLKSNWGWMHGCRVEVNGHLVKLDRIRFTDTGLVIVGNED